MEIITAYYTDVGQVKTINQDSLSVKVVNSPQGKIVFAIVCDGMGGLEQGEIASKETIVELNDWFMTQFAKMVADNTVSEDAVYQQWQERIERVSARLGAYAQSQGVTMGTTLTAILIYKAEYYVCHVGDSRIYRIDDVVNQVTTDHTLVAKEVELGYLTEEQAKIDPRRSILLQCVGASEVIEPQFEKMSVTEDTTFILSSDGFVHLITEEEMYRHFRPEVIEDKKQLTDICEAAVKVAMKRGERDNITVIAVVLKQIGN